MANFFHKVSLKAAKSLLKKAGYQFYKPDPSVYRERLLSTSMNHDFMEEKRYLAAREKLIEGKENPGEPNERSWHLHVVLWSAAHAAALKADIVQLGVFQGGEAAAIAEYIQIEKLRIRMILVDTFEGIPEDQFTPEELKLGADSAQWLYKKTGDNYPYVKKRFSTFANVDVIKGRVPEILPEISVNKIGLLLLDLNVAFPEKAAAEYYYDKVVPGGLIISDDYGHSGKTHGYYMQKLAFDEFAASKNLEVLSLPTGHGVIFKP